MYIYIYIYMYIYIHIYTCRLIKEIIQNSISICDRNLPPKQAGDLQKCLKSCLLPPIYNPYNGSKIKKYALSLLNIYDYDKFGRKISDSTVMNIENINENKSENMEIINPDINPGPDISEIVKNDDIYDEQVFSLSRYEDNNVLDRDEIPCDDFVLWRRQVCICIYMNICIYIYTY
jgi:hypothetical protein